MQRFRHVSAVFSRRYGRFCQMEVQLFSKTGQCFVYKQYYRSLSKSKAVLRVNYGDGGTVQCILVYPNLAYPNPRKNTISLPSLQLFSHSLSKTSLTNLRLTKTVRVDRTV